MQQETITRTMEIISRHCGVVTGMPEAVLSLDKPSGRPNEPEIVYSLIEEIPSSYGEKGMTEEGHGGYMVEVSCFGGDSVNSAKLGRYVRMQLGTGHVGDGHYIPEGEAVIIEPAGNGKLKWYGENPAWVQTFSFWGEAKGMTG